ncbi:MAG: amidohydrolase [Glaciimonas sp.]|nr:amidohydrolase [Glaciimonas sp.]
MKKIVLEEHFLTPALAGYGANVEAFIDPEHFRHYKSRLGDFEDIRLQEMDAHGIDISVLSVTTPGVQVEPDCAIAVRKAKEVNDMLATVMQRNPTRFSGFAHLALQDPVEAANELERAVKQLGMCGALINGHTNGEYLDDPKFWPVWERAEALDVPIYLHPANAPDSAKCLDGYVELLGPAWAWTAETATHALRMVMGGVFDRFPKVTLVLGHMGETLPFVLWRLDSRYKMMKHTHTLQKLPSQYIRDNIMITTAGSCDVPALLCSMLALGADRIMFSVDYPYESTAEAVDFITRAPISEIDRAKICHLNAERLLRL